MGRCLALLLAMISAATPLPARAAPVVERAQIPGLDSLTSASLRRALEEIDVRPEELGFDKLYAEDDTFRLAIVEEILNDPLRLPAWQVKTTGDLESMADDLAALAGYLGALCEAGADGGGGSGAVGASTVPPGSSETDRSTRTETDPGGHRPRGQKATQEAAQRFVERCRGAEQTLARAFARLDDRDRSAILSLAPAFWADWEDPDSPDKADVGAFQREFRAAGAARAGGSRSGANGASAGVAGSQAAAGQSGSGDETITAGPVLNAAVKLDRPALTRASQEFIGALLELAGRLKANAQAEARGRRKIRDAGGGLEAVGLVNMTGVEGSITSSIETPWGLLVVGGPGPNVYTEEALEKIAFLIDPGGDDLYRGRTASAIGGLLRPFGALIDESGNDIYEAGSRAFCLGGAVLGVAVLIDRSGNDSYRGGDGVEGAGFFGAGFLLDGGGTDYFEGRNFCQGAGGFGLGALISWAAKDAPPGPPPEKDIAFDRGIVMAPGTGSRPVRYDDNDIYQCARQSQGFASTFGAGLLHDRAGSDVYRAGGHYLHRPLRPNDFQSLSQGFSIGFRPRAGGGVGLLIDDEGNDFYNAEIYAQGSSYWYSIGLLCDRGGSDRYHATQYSQGAGIHLSIGSLWDWGGDDQYVSQLGVTQGTAHDLSVGYLIDESGDDYYIVDGGQGFSITNSVAIFIDKMGNDIYSTQRVGQGALTWARGFCAPGIFLDLEGTDYYPARGAARDSSAWTNDLYGAGIDLDRDIKLPGEVLPEIVLTAADSARSIPDLFKDASLWEVGSAVETVRRARKALMAKGVAAVDYVTREKLAGDDGLEYRALVDLGKAYPDSFGVRAIPRLLDPNPQVQRNVISVLGEIKWGPARDPLLALLGRTDQKKHWTRTIQALGMLGDPAAAPAIRPFLADSLERRRIVVCGALAALKDTTAVAAIAALLDDPLLTVRSAALAATVPFGAAAVDPLIGRLAAQRTHRAILDETLGRTAAALRARPDRRSRRALAAAKSALLAELDRPAGEAGAPARAAVVSALMAIREPALSDRVAKKMESESDPLVRGAYERARSPEKD